ncbi:MAG: RluA family pseudouridine synthase [Deltaproteobacteria bacterium CG_4_10_14_0_2_um_filter_43_8]|nr:MAG: RluA family pseudouridine synthase [Deltaproteobacteria bacterium CG11_big_fil_rev_8_21_14_0_20_42_23]PJA18877.1 MAG: RluA family pseudouridine synthase [Deltaproteobacteria bacterium CG_4_10_14_0_2_um_filter_43_8]PJC64710.1 MAG: RluA family pseudouridine synthase [Deltaproteobacteria bacterium CG_4_9_14_0_2_um_filter_42_21]
MKSNLVLHYEDEDIILLEKPAGLPCLPSKKGQSDCLSKMLLEYLPQLSTLPDAGLVHRLDNDTSGIVMLAKDAGIYAQLRNEWNEGSVEKIYLALVLGHTKAQGLIQIPIAHHPTNVKKMICCENQELASEHKARPAHTEYKTLKVFGDYSLLEVKIITGVRHQIRVHLSHLGFPLAGDKLYQNTKRKKEDALGLKRHFLHASALCFNHPTTKERITVESKLPKDLANALEKIVASFT